MEVFNAIVILFLWIFVTAIISLERKTDTEMVKTAKRIARATLTATLIAAVVMAAFALYFSKGAHR